MTKKATCLARVASAPNRSGIYLLLIFSVLSLCHVYVNKPSEIDFPGQFTHCENLVHNITNGRWIHWSERLTDPQSVKYKRLQIDEKRFDERMAEYRIQRGIHTRLWRDDLKCGHENQQDLPNGSNWIEGGVSAWCDARSRNPCCSDWNDGTCGNQCQCPQCTDLRTILHAEYAKWVPSDDRCQWKNYTSTEACKVIEKFSEIHIVGDSFIRKMGRVLVLMLRDDIQNEKCRKYYPESRRDKCIGPDQVLWKECNLRTRLWRTNLANQTPLCGMDLSRFSFYIKFGADAGNTTLELVKQMAGKPGSLILLSVGVHVKCLAPEVINRILQPSVDYLNSYYATYNKRNPTVATPNQVRWPHIIFMFPDTPGLLKPPRFLRSQGKEQCYKFTDDMIKYLSTVGIRYLDFRKLTANIFSYDGTHHGLGLNVQKVQLLLNYLDTLKW